MSTPSVQKPEAIRPTENEEESFIILGSGPNSMSDSFMQSNSMSFIDHETLSKSTSTITNGLTNGVQQPPPPSLKSDKMNGVAEHVAINGGQNGVNDKSASFTSFRSVDGNFCSMSDFASKFLLGEINQDAVKSSVFEAFPSINTNQTKVDDVLKLYSLLDEHAQLKANLEQTNQAMRRSALVISEYQDKTKQKLVLKNRELNEMMEQLKIKDSENTHLLKAIADMEAKTMELNAVNKKLEEKNELLQVETKAAHMEVQDACDKAKKTEKVLQNEIEAFRMALSEKDSIIRNMAEQMRRLEAEKDSFVVVSESKSVQPSTVAPPSGDFITKEEHDKIVRELHHQLSQLTAENLEFTDQKRVYKDELTCLKVNLTSAEELQKQMQATVTTLRASALEHSKRAEQANIELKNAKEQIDLLSAQVEVYRTDFEQEREARAKLAAEKDNLAADLKLLQTRNKELIDDAQKRLSAPVSTATQATSTTSQPSASAGPSYHTGAIKKTPSSDSPKSNSPKSRSPKSASPDKLLEDAIKYICPICNEESKTLRLLEQHIEICLKE